MDFRTRIENTLCSVRATALIIKENQLFLIQKKDAYYAICGALKVHETSEEAVKREVREELGIDVRVKQLVFIVENQFEQDDQQFHNIEFHYLVEPLESLPDRSYEDGVSRPIVGLSIDRLVNHTILPAFLSKELPIWSGEVKHIINIDNTVKEKKHDNYIFREL